MRKESNNHNDLWRKLNELSESMLSLSESLKDKSNSQLKYCLKDIAESLVKNVEDSFNSKRYIDKKRSFLEATTSLGEARVYISMAESFGYGDYKRLKNQVDEVNILLTEKEN